MGINSVHRASLRLPVWLLAIGLLASCGGGGSSDGVDSGGTGVSPFLAAGPISGFGSVILNDIRFETSTASVQDDDGVALSPDQLRLGMTTRIDASDVSIVGGQATATARAVGVGSELIGPIERIDPLLHVFRVLGQTVFITPATVFDVNLAGGFGRLTAGATVEIHGQFNAATQRYVATRVTPIANPTAYKIRGIASSVDPVGRTLVVGGLNVSYASLPSSSVPTLTAGQFVRVRLALQPSAGVWSALSVAGPPQILDRPRVRLIGRISSWSSSTAFSVNGVPINASAVPGAATNADIALGARVFVEGPTSGGVLNATSLFVKGDESLANTTFELHGLITAIDVSAQTLVVRGVNIHYGASTQFQGGLATDLALGRRVDVIGSLSSDSAGLEAQMIAFE